jgi:hypothetical protein
VESFGETFHLPLFNVQISSLSKERLPQDVSFFQQEVLWSHEVAGSALVM